MGKFVDEKAIVNRNIENYNNFVNERGKFLEGGQTLVTYFQKNNKASLEDVGLGNVVEIIGSESPIKFNRIENLPLYNFDTLGLQYEYDDETGMNNNIEGTAIIIPGTIKPLSDEFFSVSYLNKDFLFKITNVEGNTIGSKFFYKIEYQLSRNNLRILEERQIANRYEVDYNSLGGSKNSPIITSDLYSRLKLIEDLLYDIRKDYNKDYYNASMNGYFYNMIYDNCLHMFLSNHRDILIDKKTMMENMYIEPLFDESGRTFKEIYNHTLFSIVDDVIDNDDSVLDMAEIFNGNVSMDIQTTRKSKFGRSHDTFIENIWSIKEIGEWDTLINALILQDKTKHWFAELLLTYMDEELTLSTICDKILNSFILHKKQIRYSLESYILLPCTIFIFIGLKNKILKESNNFLYEKKGVQDV